MNNVAAIGLATLSRELDVHPRDLDEESVASAEIAKFAPKVLPEYVQHQEGATRAGIAAAHAVIIEFEATAKELEKLGEELKAAEQRAEESRTVFAKAMADLNQTVMTYRSEAARVFKHIEDVTKLASDASALSAELRERAANTILPTS